MKPTEIIVHAMGRLYDRRLTTTSGGNLSVRDVDGAIWITPSGLDKASLSPEQMARLEPDGASTGLHAPSLEAPFHRSVYAARPDVRAVVHAHSPALTAFCAACRLPDLDALPELAARCGRLGRVPYGTPGSEALSRLVGDAIRNGEALLLDHHGALAVGASMEEALTRFELLEHAAWIVYLTEALGGGTRRVQAAEPCAGEVAAPPPGSAAPDEATGRALLVSLIRRGWRQGLVAPGAGSWSLRLDDGRVLITPRGMAHPMDLQPVDLVAWKAPWVAWDGLPDDAAGHVALYRERPELASVFRAYPPYAAARGLAARSPVVRTLTESFVILRRAAVVSAAAWRTGRLPPPLRAGSRAAACLLPGAGAAAWGRTPLEAFDRLEVLEHTLRANALAESLGGPVVLPPEALRALGEG